ncbi:phenoloxidase-activating factor 3-like [Venturia canescens]|uniref:phenoloxidase-activating factor 3-like n=1 Tax=Venturia canescens TaxID=32260 RepID=UPI001C9D63D6|nr:phenoloxidase-activating factor 3-like [Venturia canescens]
MYLQEYVKYLICVLIIYSAVPQDREFTVRAEEQHGDRKSRGVWDLIFGRFRTCGSCVCGKSNRNYARLLGGEDTQSHEFPWLTNVHVKSNKLVSGILINDRYVLTAASQLVGATAPEIKVSLGEYDRCNIDISSINSSVETVTMYPEFNPDSHAHDLALVRLSRPIKFEKRISPVCLPNPGSSYLGQVGTVFGWTESKSSDDIDTRTCRPRKLGLPILGYNECIKSGINPKDYHDDSGCVGVVGVNSVICNNDVGSSLLYRSYTGIYDLVGILSDVNECDDKPRTAVFTKIGPHLDWILQNTKDACYCTK